MDKPDQLESELLHQFKNQIAIALGYCDLLIEEFPDGDPRKTDLAQMQQALQTAMDLMPQLAAQMK